MFQRCVLFLLLLLEFPHALLHVKEANKKIHDNGHYFLNTEAINLFRSTVHSEVENESEKERIADVG
jgi:hypothetical protein